MIGLLRFEYPALMHVCLSVGVSPHDASTDVTMQANPSYTAVEENISLEPNPCYSAVQANSAYESTGGHGEDLKIGFEYTGFIMLYFITLKCSSVLLCAN